MTINPLVKSIALRFLRAFVAGGLSTAVAVGATNIQNLADMRAWGLSLVVAFITGGLMAIDKLMRSNQ